MKGKLCKLKFRFGMYAFQIAPLCIAAPDAEMVGRRTGSPMLLSVGKFVFILDKRVEVVEQPNTGDWILVIKVRNLLKKGTV
jgi:hypothetical protein